MNAFPEFFESKEDKSIVDAIELMGQYTNHMINENKMLTHYIRDNMDVNKIKEMVRLSQRNNNMSPNKLHIATEASISIDSNGMEFPKSINMPRNKKPIEINDQFMDNLKIRIVQTENQQSSKNQSSTDKETGIFDTLHHQNNESNNTSKKKDPNSQIKTDLR